MAKLCVGKRKGDFNNFDLTDDLKIKALKSAHVCLPKTQTISKIVNIEKEGKNAKKK